MAAPGGAVTHPLHQLAQVRARGSRQDVASVAKIVKVEIGQASIRQRREPHPAAEVGVPHRAPGRAGEQQAVVLGSGESREVPGKIGHDQVGKRDGPPRPDGHSPGFGSDEDDGQDWEPGR
jgi:hypothetical protein